MRVRAQGIVGAVATAASLLLHACVGNDPAPSPASADDGGTALGPPATCSASPSDDATVLRDECGIFVSPTGDDGHDGTAAQPLLTITKAIEIATTSKKARVYVCNGLYVETVSVSDSQAGVSLFGGLECAPTWAYRASTRATLRGKTPGFVLTLRGPLRKVSIEDLEVLALPGASAGESSGGIFVAGGSQGVSLRRLRVVAADGVAGASGETQLVSFPAPLMLTGQNMSINDFVCTNLCGEGAVTTGGRGGYKTGGGDGAPVYTPSGGKGGTAAVVGGDGSPGTDGAITAPPTSVGTLEADGWHPAGGASGARGKIGQGGGGGGAASACDFKSGTGGCGGCGGGAGTGGKGGGASIAIALVDTPASIVASVIETGRGGAGGGGAPGQPGQPGGSGGHGATDATGTAANGGAGGSGGAGTGGAGGAGGVSVGILYRGAVPSIDVAGTAYTLGAAGAKGHGGQQNDGPDGVSVQTLESK